MPSNLSLRAHPCCSDRAIQPASRSMLGWADPSQERSLLITGAVADSPRKSGVFHRLLRARTDRRCTPPLHCPRRSRFAAPRRPLLRAGWPAALLSPTASPTHADGTGWTTTAPSARSASTTRRSSRDKRMHPSGSGCNWAQSATETTNAWGASTRPAAPGLDGLMPQGPAP